MATVQHDRIWRLSPSDLYVFSRCRRCFWLRVTRGIAHPRGAFPSVFSVLDRQVKDRTCTRPAQEIADGVPEGRVIFRDRNVRSVPLSVPHHTARVRITGRIDTAVELAGGGFAIVDFKLSASKRLSAAYEDQLALYALATENADPGSLFLDPVRALGIIRVDPSDSVAVEGGVGFLGVCEWVPVERDDDRIYDLLSQALVTLGMVEGPDAAPGCEFCEFALRAAVVALEQLQRRRE